MGNADRRRNSGRSHSRRGGAWRPWSWCSGCQEAYFYHHQVKSDSTCRLCTARLLPQLQKAGAPEALGHTYLEEAQLANAREQHAKAAADGDKALVASLEAIFPVLKPEQAPPPKTALELLQQASTKAMQAKRRLDKAVDWAAKLRVKLKDAEDAKVKLYVEAQEADEAHAAARENHARTCALPTQQRPQFAPTPTATEAFGCDLQGLEQDEDIKAALAQFQLLQQAFAKQVQAKRAASPVPPQVPAALPPDGSSNASGPPAAQPDNGTAEDHEMGEADTGKRKNTDREEDQEAQRVKQARVQVLADVKSAGDEQKKQFRAQTEAAATPPDGSPSASDPPAAQPDHDTAEDLTMGEADTGKLKDADPQADQEAQRVKQARVQLLADVKSLGDAQKKQLGAQSDE